MRVASLTAAIVASAGAMMGTMIAKAAHADERPPWLPTRDVAIIYNGQSDGQAKRLTVLYSAATERMRAEQEGQSSYVIIDGRAMVMRIVMDRRHEVIELPFDTNRLRSYIMSDQAHFTRQGADTVAGLACTVWDVTTSQSHATACITADGVILRGEGSGTAPTGQSGQGRIEAISVQYAPQPPDVFHVPPRYNPVGLADLLHKFVKP
jgi:hypothetical protein